ncbi:MAG: Gmad2 immunoglobulin-like domain-containing protein, partial [Candidatus Moraniibacteriota bacterium]
ARLCPDGSAVGRSGPNCEFAPCPQQSNPSVTDFESCAARGNPVMESSPRRCSANSQTYTEGTSVSADLSDDVRVAAPQPDAAVVSPLTVRGVARGTWFFEASFPVRLVDADGRILASGAAQAESDWMTTEFVPFETTLSFALPMTATGTLILEQDNPSGLPENTANFRLPVQFETHR